MTLNIITIFPYAECHYAVSFFIVVLNVIMLNAMGPIRHFTLVVGWLEEQTELPELSSLTPHEAEIGTSWLGS
jgi:hypothetical protein